MPIGDIFQRCFNDVDFYLKEGRTPEETVDLVWPRIKDALEHYHRLTKYEEKRRVALLVQHQILQTAQPTPTVAPVYRSAILRGLEEYKKQCGSGHQSTQQHS